MVRRGWWGRAPMLDPVTGETRIVQLGSPHRLRAIFETNLRASYAAGRWERIQRVSERLPYLRYVAVLDGRTREEHAAWHGTVALASDDFWDTHYPPNGWGCRCLVQQLGEEDLERFGYEVTGPPSNARDTRPHLNRRTGEITQVPFGIDPGWDHNVGAVDQVSRSRDRLDQAIESAPPDVARRARRDLQNEPGS